VESLNLQTNNGRIGGDHVQDFLGSFLGSPSKLNRRQSPLTSQWPPFLAPTRLSLPFCLSLASCISIAREDNPSTPAMWRAVVFMSDRMIARILSEVSSEGTPVVSEIIFSRACEAPAAFQVSRIDDGPKPSRGTNGKRRGSMISSTVEKREE
jgi:hypothetical protein